MVVAAAPATTEVVEDTILAILREAKAEHLSDDLSSASFMECITRAADRMDFMRWLKDECGMSLPDRQRVANAFSAARRARGFTSEVAEQPQKPMDYTGLRVGMKVGLPDQREGLITALLPDGIDVTPWGEGVPVKGLRPGELQIRSA